jgi:hypothetical protein
MFLHSSTVEQSIHLLHLSSIAISYPFPGQFCIYECQQAVQHDGATDEYRQSITGYGSCLCSLIPHYHLSHKFLLVVTSADGASHHNDDLARFFQTLCRRVVWFVSHHRYGDVKIDFDGNIFLYCHSRRDDSRAFRCGSHANKKMEKE